MNMWMGLVPGNTHAPKTSVPAVDPRLKILEDLLLKHGPLDSREIAKHLDWRTAKIRDVAAKSDKVMICGKTEVAGTALRKSPLIGLVENWEAGLNRRQKASPKLATSMSKLIDANGAQTYHEMAKPLSRAVGLIKDVVNLRRDVFEVVGHREVEFTRKVTSQVYRHIDTQGAL